MKKFGLSFVLALAVVFSIYSVSWAGLCLDDAIYCNDDFVTMSKSEGVYSLHGYEAGCGYSDRLMDGSMILAGGYAYIGLTGAFGLSGAGDNGSVAMRHAVVNLSNYSFTNLWNYVYLSGGVIAGHSGSGTGTLSICPNLNVQGNVVDANDSAASE